MGLLDELAGAVLSSSGGKSPLMGSVLQMLTGAQGGDQGGGQLERLAQQHGNQPEAAASQLAQTLPGIVDKLTPGGKIPDAQSLQGLLKGLLG